MIKKFILSLIIHGTAIAASHNPQHFLNGIHGTKNEGEQIVKEYCSNCHAVKAIIELGAPKISEINDWGPRVKQGLDVLFKHTDEGFGAMPARGGCFECSDQQLKLAILAMLPKSVPKVYK